MKTYIYKNHTSLDFSSSFFLSFLSFTNYLLRREIARPQQQPRENIISSTQPQIAVTQMRDPATMSAYESGSSSQYDCIGSR